MEPGLERGTGPAHRFVGGMTSPRSLKGPLLSWYLYGELGARSSGDIDLLVKPGDLLRIRDLLLSRGFRVANTLHLGWICDMARFLIVSESLV